MNTPATDRLSADERVVFIRLLAAAALAYAERGYYEERPPEEPGDRETKPAMTLTRRRA